MDFKDKACIVTGASRGIGRGIAEAFLERGAKVLFLDVLWKDGETAQKELSAKFGADRVQFMYADVSSHTNFERAFLRCRELFGGVDVLVNNAGINGDANWETMLDINLKGTITGCKLAVRYMGKGSGAESTGRGGLVINISSVQALMSWPAMPAYSAGKAGIVTFTRCYGHDVEYVTHGVRIACLCPYGVATPMNDYLDHIGMTDAGKAFLQSLGAISADDILRPSDVAEAVVKVADEAKTGSVWYVHKRGTPAWEVKDQMGWENLMACKPE